MLQVKEQVKENHEFLIETRRYLHENPEVSGKEFNTSKYLKEMATNYGLEVKEASTTGFIAILDTGKPGKTIGLRTDIDALPILEAKENLKQPKVTISKHDGVMHACGHDGHMAMLLTTMKILVENQEQLKGKIIFIFEEGEENWSGIHQMIDTLRDLDVTIDAIYGNHLFANLETGKVSVDSGAVMAGAIGGKFIINGRKGHVSRPDLAANPIFASANILTNIASAWANQLDVTKGVTLGITELVANTTTTNIIPDEVVFAGSFRFYDLEEAEKGLEVAREVAEGVAKVHQCTARFESYKNTSLPVMNDEKLTALVQEAVMKTNPNALYSGTKWFASESFSRYNEIAPSVFTFIGIKNDDYGSGADHHNERFDIDEGALLIGVETCLQFTYDFLA